MIEIRGKYNEAKIFTDVVDSASIAQVQELCNQEFTAGSRIRLMPDIHAGAGCTIGTTMTIKMCIRDRNRIKSSRQTIPMPGGSSITTAVCS